MVGLTSCGERKKPELTEAEILAKLEEEERRAEAEEERKKRERREKLLAEAKKRDLEELEARSKRKAEEARKQRESESGTEPDAAETAATDEPDWNDIVAKRIARESMISTNMDKLVTTDGKKYREAQIKEATRTGIKIYHMTGIADIDYEKLQPELQKKFLYDPAEAAAARAGEPEPRLSGKYLSQVRDGVAKARNEQMEEADKAMLAKAEKTEATRTQIDKIQRALVRAEEKLKDLQKKAEIARHGTGERNVRKSSADSSATFFADSAVKKQEAVVAKIKRQLDQAHDRLRLARRS